MHRNRRCFADCRICSNRAPLAEEAPGKSVENRKTETEHAVEYSFCTEAVFLGLRTTLERLSSDGVTATPPPTPLSPPCGEDLSELATTDNNTLTAKSAKKSQDSDKLDQSFQQLAQDLQVEI